MQCTACTTVWDRADTVRRRQGKKVCKDYKVLGVSDQLVSWVQGTEVEEAGIRLVLECLFKLVCAVLPILDMQDPSSGPYTHKHTHSRPACTLAPLLAQNGSHSFQHC